MELTSLTLSPPWKSNLYNILPNLVLTPELFARPSFRRVRRSRVEYVLASIRGR